MIKKFMSSETKYKMKFPHLFKRIKAHWHTIYSVILNDPLNKGKRLHYFESYLKWNFFYKYRNKRFIISLENGMHSFVYPFPDHDSGEENIYTRNVDYYDNRFVRKFIQQGDFIVDAGCNIGNRTLALADIISGALMIDANQFAIDRVRENLLLNDLNISNYILVTKAVGAVKGVVHFTNIGGAHTNNRVVYEDTQQENNFQTYPVEMTTIDEELTAIGKHPSFIKVDVEGQDLAALQGSIKTLQNGIVKLVKFEHNRTDPLEPIIDFFNSIDWMVFALDQKGKPTIEKFFVTGNMNLFAMPLINWSDWENV